MIPGQRVDARIACMRFPEERCGDGLPGGDGAALALEHYVDQSGVFRRGL